jgi:hypothetical protein
MNTLIHKGNARTDAIADAIYQLSPSARAVLSKAKDRFANEQHGMLKDAIAKSLGGRLPNTEAFVSQVEKVGRRAAAPHYEKFYKSNEVVLPERLMGDPKFKAVQNRAMLDYNDLDRGKPGFLRASPRTLNATKKLLSDEIEQAKKYGKNETARLNTIPQIHLRELLVNHSPSYDKALKFAQEYLRAKGATQAGKNFRDMTAQDIAKFIGDPSKRMSKGFREGVLESLIEKMQKRAEAKNFSNLGRELGNKEIQSLIAASMEKNKSRELFKKAQEINKAFGAFSKFTGRSQTSEHLANINLIPSAVKASTGGIRSLVNLGRNVINKFTLKPKQQTAKIQMKALLNPQVLAEARLRFLQQAKPKFTDRFLNHEVLENAQKQRERSAMVKNILHGLAPTYFSKY